MFPPYVFCNRAVAPLAGAWIEIVVEPTTPGSTMSLPSRERGLKWHVMRTQTWFYGVAPLAGAWIEMFSGWKSHRDGAKVAPLAGAWIEINVSSLGMLPLQSLPSRERGLKSRNHAVANLASRSLPSRERGLKLQRKATEHKKAGSLPSRERGLK